MKELIHPKYGYRLNEGDILRFGKVRFRVKKISSEKDDKLDIFDNQENKEVDLPKRSNIKKLMK